jgi:hypothetical protein
MSWQPPAAMRWLLVGLVGCSRDLAVDLRSPAATAHTFVAAMRRHDLRALRACSAPSMRDRFDREIDRIGARMWTPLEDEPQLIDRIAGSSDTDFALAPARGAEREIGDTDARLELGRDAFEVVKAADGRWYVVDSGL